MDLSVIIVNYNTCYVTCNCLDSIFKYTNNISFEVIVVDNDSQKDDSKLVLSNYPGIKFIESGKNLGFGKANNIGYNYANGKYVLLLNSDTYLLNNALKIFVDDFNKLPATVACVGSQLLAPDGSRNDSFGDFPSISRTLISLANLYFSFLGKKIKAKSSIKESELENFVVPYITGADLCIRREVVEKEGLFDPDFFMYFEETEMQYRYKKSGYEAMIIHGPKIVHLECASTKDGKNSKFTYSYVRLYLQGQFLYFRKIYSYPLYILYRLIYLLSFPMFIRSYYTISEQIKILGCFLSSTTYKIHHSFN